MSVEANIPVDRGAALTDFGTIYRRHLPLLVGTAVAHFHISEADAEGLAHEVFLAYFLKAGEVINPRAWLLSALANASRYYLRKQARTVGLSHHIANAAAEARSPAAVLPDQLMAREMVGCATARCQLALRLRYWEGFSIPEIAEELDTSARYAQKLVNRCERQARDRYAAKEKR